jgi:D-lactate dehydrogenase (cytochrome)
VSREAHGRSEAYHLPQPPDVVAFPETTAEVKAIVAACAAAGVPIVPFGAGTSLEGNALSIHGGVCVDFARMNRVLAVHDEDMDCRVQPGITRKQLNAELRNSGCSFRSIPAPTPRSAAWPRRAPPAPMRCATAPCATTCWRSRSCSPDGEVIRTGRRARKVRAGYDLTRLFVGAEGTLGVITEITLRLHPDARSDRGRVCRSDSFGGAVDTAIAIIQTGIPVARIELLDDVMIRAVNAYAKLGVWSATRCSSNSTARPPAVAEQAARARRSRASMGARVPVCDSRRGTQPPLARTRQHALCGTRLRPRRQGRHHGRLRPDLAACRVPGRDQRDIEASGLIAPIVGHVGDGNFHTLILIDPDLPASARAASALHERMVGARVEARRDLHRRAWDRDRQAGVPRAPSTARPWQ